MGVRQKLNESYINGALVTGGILGFVTGSWTVFIIASAVLIGLAILGGGIRSKGRRYRNHRR